MWLVLVLVAATAVAGCGRNIGDDCTTSTDCSATGDRTCDMSQPGGYCTVEGCDQTSCPDNSTCVRFFPEQFLSTPCDPACEDTNPAVATPGSPQVNCPQIAPLCAGAKTNDCSADQLCLPSGLCVPRADEQRLCVKTCGSDSDCRGGYQCRAGGTLGSLPLLNDPCGTVSFCAPRAD
jgi:hypothetical protein